MQKLNFFSLEPVYGECTEHGARHKLTTFWRLGMFLLCLLPLLAAPYPCQAQAFDEEFNGTSLDAGNWLSYGKDDFIQGLTRWRDAFGPGGVEFLTDTDGVTHYAHLKLNLYNPEHTETVPYYDGQVLQNLHIFRGTDIRSKEFFQPAISQSVAYEARLRCSAQSGVVSAFWVYGGDNSGWDEVDAEYLGKQDHHLLKTTSFSNFYQGHPYTNSPEYYDISPRANLGFDWTQWHYMEIVWTRLADSGGQAQYKVQWFAKANEGDAYNLVATAPQAIPHTYSMQVRLNIWVPKWDWGEAYDPQFLAVSTPI